MISFKGRHGYFAPVKTTFYIKLTLFRTLKTNITLL